MWYQDEAELLWSNHPSAPQWRATPPRPIPSTITIFGQYVIFSFQFLDDSVVLEEITRSESPDEESNTLRAIYWALAVPHKAGHVMRT